MSHILKAETQIALGDRQAARNTITKALEELENNMRVGNIVETTAAENKFFLARMHKMLE
jgi:hypothetical protein